MFIYTTLALILCATLVVTSSVNESKTDGFSSDNHDASLVDEQSSHSTASSKTMLPKMTGEHVDKHDLDLPMMAEGGPIYRSGGKNSSIDHRMISSTTVPLNEAVKEISDDSSTGISKVKLPKTRNASVVARKGVIPSPKIAARKGVGPEILPMMESTTRVMDEAIAQVVTQKMNINEQKMSLSTLQTTADTKKHTIQNNSSLEYSKVNISTDVGKNASILTSNESEKSDTLLTLIKPTPTIVTKSFNDTPTTSSMSTKRFKAKPTVTIGEMDADKPIPASPTKTPPLGMPRKIDYIVPVIITIMALPLLGGATLMLYRRGRDCWDKRHYRRMDFLIDGMYNDYNWK